MRHKCFQLVRIVTPATTVNLKRPIKLFFRYKLSIFQLPVHVQLHSTRLPLLLPTPTAPAAITHYNNGVPRSLHVRHGVRPCDAL